MKKMTTWIIVLIVFFAVTLSSCSRITVTDNTGDRETPDNEEAIVTPMATPSPSEEVSPSPTPQVSEPPSSDGPEQGSDINIPAGSDYILSESNTRRYDYMELYQYFDVDPSLVAYARNEIFARHGHLFDTKAYQDYFSKKSWYHPEKKVAFDALNPDEQYNAKLLLFYEKGYQGPYPPDSQRTEMPENPPWYIHNLAPGETYKVDLDGDGSVEKVSWKRNVSFKATIEVNDVSAKVTEENSGNWGESIAIVDMDPDDSFKEMVVCDEGPSNDEWSYVYEYRNEKITMIGEAAGYIEYGSFLPDGRGGVTALTRASLLQTWFYKKDYRLDANHRLKAVPRDYYPACHPVFIRKPIKLSETINDGSRLFTVKDGQAALLSATDNGRWVRLTLEDGTAGWFEVTNFDTIVRENVLASEIFDNLSYAD